MLKINNMYDEILEKLKEQRGENSQVSDITLGKMAKRFSKYITTAEDLEKEDFTEDIENVQGNIGHIAKQVKEDTEKNLKVNKPKDLVIKQEEKKENESMSPEVAALLKQNEQILKELSGIKGEKITETRVDSLNQLLENAPDYYKSQVISGFQNMKFETNEDFDAFKDVTKGNFDKFVQSAKEDGLNKYMPESKAQKQEGEDLNPTFKKALDATKEDK